MRYGAMNFPIKTILSEIEEIAELGFDYLELAMDPPQAHYATIQEYKKPILKTLNTHCLQLVCHLPTFVSIADLTESIRKASLTEMIKSLEVAAELNALKVVLHPGHIAGLGIFVVETVMQYGLDSLETIIAKADQLGLCVCLENMFPRTGSFFEPADFTEILERFPNLKLTLDSGHANIGSQNDNRIFEFVKQFNHRIGHIHISDNLGKRDDHLPIGEGTINFYKIAKVLKECGYDDTITLEIFAEDRRKLMSSKEDFAAMLAAV
ncbi:MAG: sugar phosphate isomerase/epimerase [Chloroflexota bacterium]|nr:MAG: sugar phosphate isomerase/epimerase [Chloroflexota bacterium]